VEEVSRVLKNRNHARSVRATGPPIEMGGGSDVRCQFPLGVI